MAKTTERNRNDLPRIPRDLETRLIIDQTPKTRHVILAASEAEAHTLVQERAAQVAGRLVYVFKLERVYGSVIAELDLSDDAPTLTDDKPSGK